MRCKWFTPALCLMVVAAPAAAQDYWSNPGNNELSLELVRPMLPDDELTTTSFALFAGGTINLTKTLAVAFDFPYARAAYDIGEAETSSSIGNPYVGVEYAMPALGLQLTGGARLPLAKLEIDNFLGQALGILSTIDRMEAFVPEAATLQASARLTRELTPNFFVSGRLGANMALYTDTEEGEDSSDLFTLYGAQGWYQTGALRVGGGLLGRLLLTGEEDSSFSDNSWHEAGLWLDYAVGPTRPGIFIRMPLDDEMSDIMDFTIGLGVSYKLPR
jgi:hypothetical protein